MVGQIWILSLSLDHTVESLLYFKLADIMILYFYHLPSSLAQLLNGNVKLKLGTLMFFKCHLHHLYRILIVACAVFYMNMINDISLKPNTSVLHFP
jgi:hypothetical protein